MCRFKAIDLYFYKDKKKPNKAVKKIMRKSFKFKRVT